MTCVVCPGVSMTCPCEAAFNSELEGVDRTHGRSGSRVRSAVVLHVEFWLAVSVF